MKEKSIFRNSVANFIKNKRKQNVSNKNIRPLVVAFYEGWDALSNEFDKINKQYEQK